MEIQASVKTIKNVAKNLGAKQDQLGLASWRYKNGLPTETVTLSLEGMELDSLKILREELKANEERSARQVTQLINALEDPVNKPVVSLQDLPAQLKAYLSALGNPWLFSLEHGLSGVAYAVMNVQYNSGQGYRGRDEAYVEMTLAFNTRLSNSSKTVYWRKNSLRQTVPLLLREAKLVVADEDLMETYETYRQRFEEFGGQQGEQFWVRRMGWAADDGGGRERYWWDRSEEIDLYSRGKPSKAVLDMESLGDSDTTRPYLHSELYNSRVKVPTHPVLCVFSLLHHRNVWVNVENMREYVYEVGLKERLVLPESHSRLVSALVSNLKVLQQESEAEDRSRTIRAKAGSSIILAKGPAGTGKTLTAEVYAEEMKRPLYEVNSGQIGVTPEEIEENLSILLARSVRLNMPMLINEADVFIQARGRDLLQNAVVSVFLRLLEYHNGLVFLTTNRAEDIDQAILNRCLAEIQYGIPGPSERKKIWRVLLAEFNVELSKSELEQVVTTFPKVVGRDIQNLIRLTSRVCTADKVPFNLQALKECAVFRSVYIES